MPLKKNVTTLVFLFMAGFRLPAAEPDSLAVFDRLLSYQSSLSIQERIAVTEKAERYAAAKGDVYKTCSYIAHRAYLYFSADEGDSCLYMNSALIPRIEKFVEETGEARWKTLLTDCYSDVALCMLYNERSDSAMFIYQGLLLRFEKDTIPYIQARCLNGIGVVFAYRKVFDLAEGYFISALEKYTAAGHTRGIFAVSSNMVAFFQTQGMYEEALPYGVRAYRIAHTEDYNGQERIYASMAMGTIYSGMERYDVAMPYFEEAVKISREKNFAHMEGFAEASYARNLYNMGRYAQARRVAEDALRQVGGKKKYALQLDLLQILGDVAGKQDDTEAALSYMREHAAVRDSQMAMANMRQLLNIQYRYDTYAKEMEVMDKTGELERALDRGRKHILWIAVLLTGIVILVFAVLFLTGLLLRFRRAAVRMREETLLRIKAVEDQVEAKDRELAANALRFLKLNNLQESITQGLLRLKTAFSLRGKEKRAVCEIEEMVRQISSGNEWTDFRYYFEQVDKGFLVRLSERFPELTSNEKHLCVLFKLGLSNKDVANLAGRTLQSVGMAKFRLRSKLNLDREGDLTAFLNAI
ncbi:MAG: tetratricopeptide repeat protein [Bacteroides sp.]|nr:tetratricopeptide repeat protein [Bacteroides sp.]